MAEQNYKIYIKDPSLKEIRLKWGKLSMLECVQYIKSVVFTHAVRALSILGISSNPFMNGQKAPKTFKYIYVIK